MSTVDIARLLLQYTTKWKRYDSSIIASVVVLGEEPKWVTSLINQKWITQHAVDKATGVVGDVVGAVSLLIINGDMADQEDIFNYTRHYLKLYPSSFVALPEQFVFPNDLKPDRYVLPFHSTEGIYGMKKLSDILGRIYEEREKIYQQRKLLTTKLHYQAAHGLGVYHQLDSSTSKPDIPSRIDFRIFSTRREIVDPEKTVNTAKFHNKLNDGKFHYQVNVFWYQDILSAINIIKQQVAGWTLEEALQSVLCANNGDLYVPELLNIMYIDQATDVEISTADTFNTITAACINHNWFVVPSAPSNANVEELLSHYIQYIEKFPVPLKERKGVV